MDRLYRIAHNVQESWRPTMDDRYDLIEGVIERGSAMGLSINEVLDSPETRLGARLSLAARHLQALPRINAQKHYRKVELAAAKKGDCADSYIEKHAVNCKAKRWVDGAKAMSADRMETPNSMNTRSSSDPKHGSRHPKLFAHHTGMRADYAKKQDPTEDGKAWLSGADKKTPLKAKYTDRSTAQFNRIAKNQDKFLRDATDSEKGDYEKSRQAQIAKGGSDAGPDDGKRYTGAGYSAGRDAAVHVHAKIAAHADADDEHWAKNPEKKDAAAKAWFDAHAKRHGEVPHPDAVKRYADDVHKHYRDRLEDQAHGRGDWVSPNTVNRDLHDIRTREYNIRKEKGKDYQSTPAIKWVRDTEASKHKKKEPIGETNEGVSEEPGKYLKMAMARKKNSASAQARNMRKAFLRSPDGVVKRTKADTVLHPWQQKKVGGVAKAARAHAYDTTTAYDLHNLDGIDLHNYWGNPNDDYDESYGGSGFEHKLNPRLNSRNMKGLLDDLHAALRKVPKTERDVLGKAFPSKYGQAGIAPVLKRRRAE